MSTVLPKVCSISSRVIRILGCNPSPMTLQGTNTYVIGTGKRRVLLDCGHPGVPEYIGLLKNVLKENDCTLSNIIVSHWHIDHIGGVPDILKEVSNECQVSKFPRKSNGSDEDLDQNIKYKYLEDGDKIETEGATLKVVYAPGHTDDHLILLLEEENSLFSGDCVLGEGTAVFEDLHDYLLTLRNLQSLNPDRIYPGHGPVIESPGSKISEYIQHRMSREKQILETLGAFPKGLTAKEIVEKIYTTTPVHLHKAAEFNVSHHLKKLLKEKTISEQSENTDDSETLKYVLL